MKIKNNPIDILLTVFEDNYPKIADKIKEISFAKVDKGYACTVFSDDEIYIYISPIVKNKKPITFEIATELLAHELAHAICGENAEHNEKWEQTFERLNELFYEFLENRR